MDRDQLEFEFAVSQYLDGTLAEDQRAGIEEKLRTDPEGKWLAIAEEHRKLNEFILRGGGADAGGGVGSAGRERSEGRLERRDGTADIQDRMGRLGGGGFDVVIASWGVWWRSPLNLWQPQCRGSTPGRIGGAGAAGSGGEWAGGD